MTRLRQGSGEAGVSEHVRTTVAAHVGTITIDRGTWPALSSVLNSSGLPGTNGNTGGCQLTAPEIARA